MTQLARGAREALDVLDSLLREAIDDLDDADLLAKRDMDETRRRIHKAQARIRETRERMEEDLAPRLLRAESRNLAQQIADLAARVAALEEK